MAKWGSCDFRQLQELQKKLEKAEKQRADFCEMCAKELAARLLYLVDKRTLPGDHPVMVEFTAHIPSKHVEFKTKEGKEVSFNTKPKVEEVKFEQHTGVTGGTLRRAWTVGEIRKQGDNYVIEVINPTEYASWVEFGHRTANHKGWVPGHFMLTTSEKELQRATPAILEKKLKKFLEDCLNAE